MSLMVAVAGGVPSTPAWTLPSKNLRKFSFAFHLILKGLWNAEQLQEEEEH